MAYSDIGDVVSGGTITEAWGDGVRANFQAGVPDIFTAKGDLAAATGADAAARLAVGANDATLVADSTQATGLAWQIQPAARVYKSTTTTCVATTWTTLEFDQAHGNTDAMWADTTTTTRERFTIPAGGAGWYIIGAHAIVSGASPNSFALRILLNGTTEIGAAGLREYDSGLPRISVTTSYQLNATDYLNLQYYSTSASVTIAVNPAMWAIWQRRQ